MQNSIIALSHAKRHSELLFLVSEHLLKKLCHFIRSKTLLCFTFRRKVRVGDRDGENMFSVKRVFEQV